MIPCLECGKAIAATQTAGNRKFCCTPCRTRFNRRRQVRGAQLYDFFMAQRYERDRAAHLGIDRTFLARIGEMFRAEDNEQRDGRQSWQDPADAHEASASQINARVGHVAGGRCAPRKAG